jgi:hypothetical protein
MKISTSIPFGPLGLAFLLCACPGKVSETNDGGWIDTADTEDTSDTSDTSDTADDAFPTGDFTEQEVLMAISSAELPNIVFLMSSLLAAFGDETSCPSVMEDEAGQTTTIQAAAPQKRERPFPEKPALSSHKRTSP